MASSSPVIILDRDGVLNRMVIDAEHGTIDSPLHPSQVEVFPWVPEALSRLTAAGYELAIATNQPAAAKGKTTRANLDAVHRRVLELVQAAGGTIAGSHICYHRAEAGCSCRKPRTDLLERALAGLPPASRKESWMAGDGVTDVAAGAATGIKTAFFGPRKCDACKILQDLDLHPTLWGRDLRELTALLT